MNFILNAGLAVLGTVSTISAQYKHPALLNNRAELDFIKGRIQANAEPWLSAYNRLRTDSHSSLTYTPSPRAVVECGSYSNPDFGCTDEKSDASAAYSQALMWYFSGNNQYAVKCIQILNAWSAVLTQHTNSNAPLQAAWTGSVFPRAAEIMRYAYGQWPAAEVTRFSTMLSTAFIPLIRNGTGIAGTNGNWELSMIEALMAIGVFNEDTASFNKGVLLWRRRVPAYFYLTSDGNVPIAPYGTNMTGTQLLSHWYNPGVFPNGLCQETCRDFGHTQYGLAAMINAAEIARHQGLDLYSEFTTRITAALEFHANLLLGNPAPAGLCGGTLNLSVDPTWEIAYNHFHNRLGLNLPLTNRLITTRVRISGIDHHMDWETMTHANLGAVGLPIPVRPQVEKISSRPLPGLRRAGTSWVQWKSSDGRIYALNGTRLIRAR